MKSARVLEIHFLTVLENYRGRGIGSFANRPQVNFTALKLIFGKVRYYENHGFRSAPLEMQRKLFDKEVPWHLTPIYLRMDHQENKRLWETRSENKFNFKNLNPARGSNLSTARIGKK